MSYCSPKQLLSKKKLKNSCIDTDLIDEMVKIYNRKNTTKIDDSLSREKKLDLLIRNLDYEIPCNRDYCLAYSDTLRDISDKIKREFRPNVPKKWKENKKTWLNTLDIFDVLNQYNIAFSDFKFLTVTPIDFDTRILRADLTSDVCVDNKLCNLEIIEYLKNGITRLGAVFNLDRHDQSGSHWTSLFADLSKGEIYYFDSVAKTLPGEIVKLVLRIIKQGNKLVSQNKFNIISQKHPFKIENRQISITEICNYLLKDDNFILFRFCFLLHEPLKYNIKIENNRELTGKIISRVLHMIDIAKQEHYAMIPGIENLIEHIDNQQLNIDDFIYEWVNTNINIALNNLLSSIKVVGNESDRTEVIDISLEGDHFNFRLARDLESTSLIDMSFRAYQNCIQHQFLNTECGMYSINFIDSFLSQNKSFEEIISEPIDDKTMNGLRYSKYFAPV
jgi:hypothetical protein